MNFDPSFKKDRVAAQLIVESKTFTPEEISSRVGTHWDTIHRIGEDRGHTGKRWETNVWIISVQKGGDESGVRAHTLLPQCIEELLARIDPITNSLRAFLQAEPGQLAIWISCSSPPGITLSQRTIRTLADLGLSLDIDVIVQPSDS